MKSKQGSVSEFHPNQTSKTHFFLSSQVLVSMVPRLPFAKSSNPPIWNFFSLGE